jgi:hypothetical protein
MAFLRNDIKLEGAILVLNSAETSRQIKLLNIALRIMLRIQTYRTTRRSSTMQRRIRVHKRRVKAI